MVKTQDGLNGNTVLTITDSKGMVAFHDTVKTDDVEKIIQHIIRTIR